jgi:hypothetical protein
MPEQLCFEDTVHGRVVSKDETADGHLVPSDAWIENPEGQTTTPGQFTVALPTRDGRTRPSPPLNTTVPAR